MKPEEYKEYLMETDSVVHTVGTLLDPTITNPFNGNPGN